MDEWTALEMRRTGNRTGGSNPSLSARERPAIAYNERRAFFIIYRGRVAMRKKRYVSIPGNNGFSIAHF